MDLLKSVRKSGSRGGVSFSWDDVKGSQHRENYLGHSLMAPVGRWQKNKDLSWYAKASDEELTPEARALEEERARKEEMRKVKEAEEDAMAKALGLPVPDRRRASEDMDPVALDQEKHGEVQRALREALGDDEEDERRRQHRNRHHDRRSRDDDGTGQGGIIADTTTSGHDHAQETDTVAADTTTKSDRVLAHLEDIGNADVEMMATALIHAQGGQRGRDIGREAGPWVDGAMISVNDGEETLEMTDE